MRFNRLYTTDRLEPEQQVCLTGKPAHYLHRVLRLAIGDRIVLFNGDGWDYPATISSISKDQAMAQVSARLPAVPESALDIHLVQAVSRGERMDTSLQKATELGVSIIQPLITERVEVKLHGKRLAKRMQHWQGVIISACEQSGRAKLPLLQPPVALAEWLTTHRPRQSRVLHPRAEKGLLDGLVAVEPVALVIGPEGGFSRTEIQVMQAGGVMPVQVGRRILRTETAGPAAIAALQFQLGDMA